MRKTSLPYLNLSLKDMPGEIWKDIPGFSDYYQISNYGRVKALDRWIERKSIKGDLFLKGQLLKPTVSKRRNPFTKEIFFSLNISLSKDSRKKGIVINRLVYHLFVKEFDLTDKKLAVVSKYGNNLDTRYKHLKLAKKGAVQLKAYKDKKKKKPFKIISQYDYEGNLLKTYDSVIDAAKETGLTDNFLSQVALGYALHGKGYLWRYGKRKKIKATGFPYKHVKRVGQYTVEGKLLKAFFSIAEATKITGFDSQGISNTAQKKRAAYKGFIWKYID